jgi:hypothetical protein
LLTQLTNDWRFPNQPDSVQFVSAFESPLNQADNYGVVLQGYLVPPTTGDYVLYLSSDDEGLLLLSTDSSPANKRLIAREPSWNGLRQWTNSVNQASRGSPPLNVSAPISLEAGGIYYVEALLKEGGGDDHLSVAWQIPGGSPPETGSAPIASNYLRAPLVEGPAIFLSDPQSQTVDELQAVTLSGEVLARPPVSLQWLRDSSPVGGATNGRLTLNSAALADSGVKFQLVASNAWGSVTSSPAMLSVLPDLVAPSLERVIADHALDRLLVSFSEPIEPAEAANAIHYVIEGLQIINASLLPDGRTVELVTSAQAPGQVYRLTVNGIRDRSAAGNPVSNGQVSFTSAALTRGFLRREWFTGISGASLSDLAASAKFPWFPDSTDFVTSFETSFQDLDDYGVKLSGLVTAPATGSYVFFLASDDAGALFLSTDEQASHKVMIAHEPAWNPPRQWRDAANQSSRGSPASNISAPVLLEAGRSYYIEALMKEGNGRDHIEVAWQKPGESAPENFSEPISGAYLSAYADPAGVSLTVVSNPASVTVTEHQAAVFEVSARGSKAERFYQWQCNGLDIPGANSRKHILTDARLLDSGSRYRCVVTIPGASVTSAEAVLTVSPDAAPPSLFRVEGGVGLDRVLLTFTEPLDPGEVPNLGHYALSGGISVLGAKLGRHATNVVLTTSTQTEGAEYTLSLSGLRDLSGNSIPSGTQARFFAWLNEEFVGPFPSWADVKRDYGAKGDGIADDTAAIQRALDHLGTEGLAGFSERPSSLYFPAGIYRITKSLRLFARDSVSMVGEHPETTAIRWDGPAGADMLVADGTRLSKWSRLTWDGATRARTGVFHTQTPGGWGVTGLEHSDEVFRDMATGVLSSPEPQFGQGDCISVNRCRFLRCSNAGLMTDNPMALDVVARHCRFEDCRYGAYGRNGSIYVYDSIFLRSTEADVIPPTFYATYTGIRRNTSVGSKRFVYSFAEGAPSGITIAENTVLDTTEPESVLVSSPGPVLVVDNVFRSRDGRVTGPVIIAQDGLTCIGNTFTVSNSLWCNGRTLFLDNQVVPSVDVQAELPALPPTLPNRHRTVFEAPVGASTDVLQTIIDQAAQLSGQRPVVHLPQGVYHCSRTLIIPANADLQLVGDGHRQVSELIWEGSGTGPMIRLAGPVRATIRDCSFNDSGRGATAIVLDDIDQPGSRVFTDQFCSAARRLCLTVDRLDHTEVQMQHLQYYEAKEVGLRIIGGPVRTAGGSPPGRTSFYSTVCVVSPDAGNGCEVLNNGDLLMQEFWYEGETPRFFKGVGKGHFTLDGARVNTANWSNSDPTVDIQSFQGDAAFLGVYFSRWFWWNHEYDGPIYRIRPGNEKASILVLGSQTDYRGFVQNESNDAEVGVHQSQTRVPVTPQPSQGDASPGFLRRMFARSRDAAPRPVSPVPAGATDARLYRVNIYNADTALILTRSNSPPLFANLPEQQVPEHSRLQISCAAADADLPFNRHFYSLLTAPAGASIDPTNGLFSWTPGAFTVSNTYPVTVQVVDDGSPPQTATQHFSVRVLFTNHPPVLLPPATNQVASQQTPYTFQPVADAETNRLSWTLVEGPSGMSISPDTGILSWLPTLANATGYYRVTLQAMDQWTPPRSAQLSFHLRLLPASIVAQFGLDAAAFTLGSSLPQETLGPDWHNSVGRISQLPLGPGGAQRQVLMFDPGANVPCTLRSQQVSRDQEMDLCKSHGPVFLRFAGDGTGLELDYDLAGAGYLNVNVVFGLTDLAGYPTARCTLWSTNNLRAMLLNYPASTEPDDYLTFGVEGVEFYAKYAGVEFLRFSQYLQTKPGVVGLKLWGYDDGLRYARVRLKSDKALFSDLANRIYDLRDFGLRSVQTAGSIAAGSAQLALNQAPEPPFKAGDWIIVATGSEMGQGLRGTLGVGGTWPQLHYPSSAIRDLDQSQPPNTYCWVETDGSVYQWDGAAWRNRAESVSGIETNTYYYVARAVPKALRSQVTSVSADGLTLTLDSTAQATVTDAIVFFDNAPVLNMTFRTPDWVETLIGRPYVLSVPSGVYALGDPMWLRNRPGCGIRGAGTNETRLFSPKGTPSLGFYFSGCSNAFVESLQLQGNAGLEGFGLPFYHPRSGFGGGVSETSGDPAGRGGLAFETSPGCRVEDVVFLDPLSDTYGGLLISECDGARIERIALYKRIPTLGPGALVDVSKSKGVTINDLVLNSDRLVQGIRTSWETSDLQVTRLFGRNTTCWFGGNGGLTVRGSSFLFDPLAQEGQDHWTPMWRSVLRLDGTQSAGQEILLENVDIRQTGFLNSRRESLVGIQALSSVRFLRVLGGLVSSPGYVAGGGNDNGKGLESWAQTNWIEGFRVSGLPGLANIDVQHGVVTNCWADYIRPEQGVRLINNHLDRNTAPSVGSLVIHPLDRLTNSAVLGLAGNPLEAGSTAITNGLLVLNAGGASSGSLDRGRFTYLPISGDFDVAVRLEGLTRYNNDSKAGLMLRKDTAAGGLQVNVHLYGSVGVNTQVRWQSGQAPVSSWNQSSFDTPNAWLRLRKEGTTVTTFAPVYYPGPNVASAFGMLWQTNASFDFPALTTNATPLLLGLFACAGTNAAGKLTEAVFGDMVLAQLPGRGTTDVVENALIELSVPALDFDVPSQNLTWSLASGAPSGMTIDAATGLLSWMPTEAQGPSTNLVTVRVWDDGTPSLLATNLYRIVVRETNTVPVLRAPGDQVVDELATFVLTNTAVDSDLPTNNLTFALVSAPAGMAVNANSGVATWTPSEAQGPSTNLVTVRVSDNGVPSMSATNSFQVVVREVNAAPAFSAVGTVTSEELAVLFVTNRATDPDLPANALGFELLAGPSGLELNPLTGVVRWAPTEAQGPSTNLVTVRVSDSGSPSLSATNTFEVRIREVNTPPLLAAIPAQQIAELQALGLALSASDPDLPAQPLNFGLVGGPAGLSVSSAGQVNWTPSEGQGPSTNTVWVRVTDGGTPPLSATNSFVVVVSEVNAAPVLPVQADQTVNELVMLVVTNTAIDADLPANRLIYQLLDPPAGAAIDTNGWITWTPSEAQGPSTNTILTVVTEEGASGLSATNAFAIVVREVNAPPGLMPVASQSVDELTTLTVTNQATDPDLPANALSFELLAGPFGLELDPLTGVVRWTPSEAQGPSTNVVVLKVSDDGAPPLCATNRFELIIREVNTAPVLGALLDQTLNEFSSLSLTNAAIDADLPANPMTYRLLSAPAGATIDQEGVIRWRPAAGQRPSTNVVTTEVSDQGAPPLSATNTFLVVAMSHTEPAENPVLSVPELNSQSLKLSWSTIAGRVYRVQCNSALSSSDWVTLGTDIIASGSTTSIVDTRSPTNRFYRVLLLP